MINRRKSATLFGAKLIEVAPQKGKRGLQQQQRQQMRAQEPQQAGRQLLSGLRANLSEKAHMVGCIWA
jgi:hypothetical protein